MRISCCLRFLFQISAINLNYFSFRFVGTFVFNDQLVHCFTQKQRKRFDSRIESTKKIISPKLRGFDQMRPKNLI